MSCVVESAAEKCFDLDYGIGRILSALKIESGGKPAGKKSEGTCHEVWADRCGQDFHVKLSGTGLDGECAIIYGK